MKRFSIALAAVALAATAALAETKTPPAPPTSIVSGNVGLVTGTVWASIPQPLNLQMVNTLRQGTHLVGPSDAGGGNLAGVFLAATFVSNQVSYDSRFGDAQLAAAGEFANQQMVNYNLPYFLNSSYGGGPSSTTSVPWLSNNMANRTVWCGNEFLGLQPLGLDETLAGRGEATPDFTPGCTMFFEIKGTISVANADTLFIAHDGGVIFRMSQGDPTNLQNPSVYTAPFSADYTQAGVGCESARSSNPTGSYNFDLIYEHHGSPAAALELMVVPQGQPLPPCQ